MRGKLTAIALSTLMLCFFWCQTIIFTFRIPDSGGQIEAESNGYRLTSVTAGSAADRAGLRPGDFVEPANELQPADVIFSGQPIPQWRLHSARLTVHRGKQTIATTIAAASKPFPTIPRISIVVRLLSYSVFVLLGMFLVLVRPGLMTWALFGYCLSSTAPTGNIDEVASGVFGPNSPGETTVLAIRSAVLALLALFPVFVLRFPYDIALGWRRIALTAYVAFMPVYMLMLALGAFFWTPTTDLIMTVVMLLVNVLTVAAVLKIYEDSTGSGRYRTKWAAIGVTAAVACGWVNAYIRNITGHSLVGVTIGDVVQSCAVILPITMTYAIVRHRVIDVRFVANRGLLLAGVVTLTAGVFFLLDWLFSRYVMTSRAQVAISIAIAFAAGWAVRSLRNRAIGVLDRICFPRYHATMAHLREVRLALEMADDPSRAQQLLTQGAAQALSLASASLLIRLPDGGFMRQNSVAWPSSAAWHFLPDDELVERLNAKRRRPIGVSDISWSDARIPDGVARPVIAIPIVSGRQNTAVALYGSHTNGTQLDPDEVRQLYALCSAAGSIGITREAMASL